MQSFVAKRVLFRNGERHSLLSRPGDLPVHEATLFLARYRKRGRAANTVHAVCTVLALLYRWLQGAKIDLLARLRAGQFLTEPEVTRLVDAAQYRVDDLDDDSALGSKRQVVDLNRVRIRRRQTAKDREPVGAANQAMRLRYIAS